ncbi:MAG: metallophosphoesterase [Xanthobacteraceae bacterium]
MPLTYVIADLHGRFDLLQAALATIAQHASGRAFKIVTLGDYVDRGPQSRQVIGRLMAAQAAGANLICVKGNHEYMMHRALTRTCLRQRLALTVKVGGSIMVANPRWHPTETRFRPITCAG